MKKSIKILLASLVMIAFVIGFSAFRSANTAKKETAKTQVVKKDVAKKLFPSFTRYWDGHSWTFDPISGHETCDGGLFKCSYTTGTTYDGTDDDDVAAADAEAEGYFVSGTPSNGFSIQKRSEDLSR